MSRNRKNANDCTCEDTFPPGDGYVRDAQGHARVGGCRACSKCGRTFMPIRFGVMEPYSNESGRTG